MLVSQTCHIDILRLLYTLSQSVYISQKLLPDMQANIGKGIDIFEAWDVKNYLYVVSRAMNQNQSQLRTAAETRQIREFYDRHGYEQDSKHKEGVPAVSSNLQRYFTESYIVNYSSISAYDPSVIKDNIQSEFESCDSRWYLYDAILKGCTKLFTGLKVLPIKEFHKINNQLIVEELEQRTLDNYHVFSFQILNSSNLSKNNQRQRKLEKNMMKEIAKQMKQQQRQDKDKEKQKQKQKERQKERQKEKQKMKKLKRSILQPFQEAEEAWIGRTNVFKQKYTEINNNIQILCDKIVAASKQKDQNHAFREMTKDLQKDKTLQIIGQSKYDGAHISFPNYIENLKQYLPEMIGNMVNKKYRGKDKPITNNRDLLANLQTRIQINERKKEGLEEAIKLAIKQQDYLNELGFQVENKQHPYQIIS